MAAAGPATVQADRIETGESGDPGRPPAARAPTDASSFSESASGSGSEAAPAPATADPEPDPDPDPDADADAVVESLLSLEKLDRSSPELWPAQIPGVGGFVKQSERPESPPEPSESTAAWNQTLVAEDVYLMQQLGNLSTSCLIIEVKKLHDLAYKLGVEEAKEMTRAKYLNLFKSRTHR